MQSHLLQAPQGARHRTLTVQAAARQPLLAFMVTALEGAGCRMLHVSRPDEAPFVLTFETKGGERIGVVAYAFLATRTPTINRPIDERSFQIKYGPDDKALHTIWQDPLGLYTTLFLGIDPEEGFFVAADPQVHNPTRFFIRLEFKDHHAAAITKDGWHAWERESKGPRHLLVHERLFDYETLVGGVKDNFLDLVRFERAAAGLAPGDRHLLAERQHLYANDASSLIDATSQIVEATIHPLATEFELSADQILELIAGARRLKMAVRGWVAEEKLRETLSIIPGITACERLDEEGGADLRVQWKNGLPLTIECKNVLRKLSKQGNARIDFQRTRASKTDPCSRYYAASDSDLVASCLHAVTESWTFRYIRPAHLASRVGCPGKIDNKVIVDDRWTDDVGHVFEEAYAAIETRS